MTLGGAFKDYILHSSEAALNFLIDRENKFYVIVLSLLKRNGIYRDRFPECEFPSALFVAIEENRQELGVMLEIEEDFFKIISRVSNLILRELNRKLYRETISMRKELPSEILENLECKDDEVVSCPKEAYKMIESQNMIDRLVLEMYFGVGRSYSLNVDQICSIVRVKRSTTFLKIKKFKKLLAEVADAE